MRATCVQTAATGVTIVTCAPTATHKSWAVDIKLPQIVDFCFSPLKTQYNIGLTNATGPELSAVQPIGIFTVSSRNYICSRTGTR